jgi:hypothetical protein
MRQFSDLITILDAKDATGTGLTADVASWQHLVLQVGSASSANLTIKVQGSMGNDAPTFSSAQSVSNHWDYIQCVDLEDGSLLDGDTGLAFSGTDDFRHIEVNVNGLKFLNVTVTARSAGSVTVKLICFNG